jgi:hypothetical protein
MRAFLDPEILDGAVRVIADVPLPAQGRLLDS